MADEEIIPKLEQCIRIAQEVVKSRIRDLDVARDNVRSLQETLIKQRAAIK